MYARKEEEKEEVRGWKERKGSRMGMERKRKERKKGYGYGRGDTKNEGREWKEEEEGIEVTGWKERKGKWKEERRFKNGEEKEEEGKEERLWLRKRRD